MQQYSTRAARRPSKLVKFCMLGAGLAATAVLASAPAVAGEQIFLRLDGISGGSTASGHSGEIDISKYSQAFTSTVSSNTGGGSGAGKASCGDITVMKDIDTSSPLLIGHVVLGQHINTGTITFQSTHNGNAATYVVNLKDVLITEVAQMDRTPQGVVEQVILHVQQFKFVLTPATGNPISFGFDCQSLAQI